MFRDFSMHIFQYPQIPTFRASKVSNDYSTNVSKNLRLPMSPMLRVSSVNIFQQLQDFQKLQVFQESQVFQHHCLPDNTGLPQILIFQNNPRLLENQVFQQWKVFHNILIFQKNLCLPVISRSSMKSTSSKNLTVFQIIHVFWKTLSSIKFKFSSESMSSNQFWSSRKKCRSSILRLPEKSMSSNKSRSSRAIQIFQSIWVFLKEIHVFHQIQIFQSSRAIQVFQSIHIFLKEIHVFHRIQSSNLPGQSRSSSQSRSSWKKSMSSTVSASSQKSSSSTSSVLPEKSRSSSKFMSSWKKFRSSTVCLPEKSISSFKSRSFHQSTSSRKIQVFQLIQVFHCVCVFRRNLHLPSNPALPIFCNDPGLPANPCLPERNPGIFLCLPEKSTSSIKSGSSHQSQLPEKSRSSSQSTSSWK